MITMASILNSILYSSILVAILWLASKNAKSIQAIGVSTLLITMVLILVRMFFPVELPITYAFSSDTILPIVNRFLKSSLAFSSVSLLHFILVIIVLGAFFRLFFILRNYYHIRKSVTYIKADDGIEVQTALIKLNDQRSLPKHLRVIRSCITSAPIVLGYRKPIIILPDSYTKEDTFYILRHELQHIYNGDLWKKLILELLTCVYWWFPVISIAFRRLFTSIMEYQADLSATEPFSEVERIRYLECVLRVSKTAKKQHNFPLPLGMSGDKHFDNKLLTKRFMLVLDYRSVKPKRSNHVLGILFSGLLLCISFLFVIQPYHLEPSEPDGSFRLAVDTAYIIENKNKTYDIFLNDGTFIITVDSIDDTLSDLPRKRR